MDQMEISLVARKKFFIGKIYFECTKVHCSIDSQMKSFTWWRLVFYTCSSYGHKTENDNKKKERKSA